jgi:predicted O-linked N-acetylglucosamine transferase (SPINDLY family)
MSTLAEAMAVAVRHQQAGNLQTAEQMYRMILGVDPQHADALHMLGVLASQVGRPQEAIALMEQSLAVRPDVPFFHANLGLVYQAVGNLEGAVAQQRRAIELDPQFAEAHNNLGNALREQNKLDDAVAAYREAIRLQPTAVGPANNLAIVLTDYGLLEEAEEVYRRVLELQPDLAVAHSNYLHALHYRHANDRELLAREHQKWEERHARPLARFIRPHTNVRDPERRLRIGYVSPSYFRYSVGRFLLPIFQCHDREQFEVFCYSSVDVPDPLNDRLAALVDHWKEVAGATDEQLTELIRTDQIDILVDLSSHMAHNRLLVFARKPAPVQVTYLAYNSTTGLRTIDYRLSDPYMDPAGQPTPYYSEKTVWLPETYWCYQPDQELPEPGPLPALAAGRVTFGCLNNFAKVTPEVLSLWRELLGSVPESRFVLHTREGSHRDRLRQYFAEGKVAPERLEFVGFIPFDEYLRTFERIDLALDPYPYNGGTSTCDALWQGVPVVTLAGQAPVSRAGLTLLSNIGLPDLVTKTPAEYLELARSLASDLPRLSKIRGELREHMLKSPFTDAPRFTHNLEAAFRNMWRTWCGSTG